jgi:2-amino-4-hydroxy-6-hydroxymethyldihydropteridine diphosphokinase
MNTVYLALGGNIGDVRATFASVSAQLKQLEGIFHFRSSKIYRTKAVSDLPQDDFLNAAVAFETVLPLEDLWQKIQHIEKLHGKMPKAKNAPRVLDIDIIAYGQNAYGKGGYEEGSLEVPHPYWKSRTFVLIPLLDLVPELLGVDLQKQINELQKS